LVYSRTIRHTKDAAAAANAKTAFEDFLFIIPRVRKQHKPALISTFSSTSKTANSYKVAKFYDKQKYYRAAVIYYNE